MAGFGTGRPISFMCHKLRRSRWRDSIDFDFHRVVRTGRVRGDPSKNYHRKLTGSVEYQCRCGHVGWTTHPDIMRYPLFGETRQEGQ